MPGRFYKNINRHLNVKRKINKAFNSKSYSYIPSKRLYKKIKLIKY